MGGWVESLLGYDLSPNCYAYDFGTAHAYDLFLSNGWHIRAIHAQHNATAGGVVVRAHRGAVDVYRDCQTLDPARDHEMLVHVAPIQGAVSRVYMHAYDGPEYCYGGLAAPDHTSAYPIFVSGSAAQDTEVLPPSWTEPVVPLGVGDVVAKAGGVRIEGAPLLLLKRIEVCAQDGVAGRIVLHPGLLDGAETGDDEHRPSTLKRILGLGALLF